MARQGRARRKRADTDHSALCDAGDDAISIGTNRRRARVSGGGRQAFRSQTAAAAAYRLERRASGQIPVARGTDADCAGPASGCRFEMSDVTQVLNAIEQGDPNAATELLPLVYDELRKLAASRMANEAPGQTLQP